MKKKTRILESGEKVMFTAKTQKYGVAEFTVCPIYKRGKLKELHLSPQQQPDAKENFVIQNDYSDSFSITAWTHKHMTHPNIWLHGWCKEHKCPFFRFYVPPEATSFTVEKYSTLSITFDV